MNGAGPLLTRIRANLKPGTSLVGGKTDTLPLVEPGDVLPEGEGKGSLAADALAEEDVGGCEEGAIVVATVVDCDLTHCDCLVVCCW